jgi:hypothetical protein
MDGRALKVNEAQDKPRGGGRAATLVIAPASHGVRLAFDTRARQAT